MKRCQPRRHQKSTHRLRTAVKLFTVTVVVFSSTGVSKVWGQTPDPKKVIESPVNFQRLINRVSDSEPDASLPKQALRLDGRTLFSVALTNENRVQTIQRNLKRVLNTGLSPDQLEVTVERDAESRLPVIKAQDNYLLTVTDADVAPGESIWGQAQQWQQIIEEALLRAYQERQPAYLKEQATEAGGLLILMSVGSILLWKWQRRLKSERQVLLTQTPPLLEEVLPIPSGPTVDNSMDGQVQPTTSIQQQITLQQQRHFNEIKRRLLQVGQALIWGGGSYVIVGLFPYTRWLHLLLLSILPLPLKLVGIGLSVYVAIRAGAIVIDRFFATLESGTFKDADKSRRLALRFSTYSGVFKSIVWLSCVSIGFLAGLAVLGIDLAPILAGAGIIGLAVSFASQNLIKDGINGFLILFEDQYAVGDVIMVGDVGGLVEYMNLRITQLRNSEGRLITIPNSAITIVQNLSKEWARVDLAIDLAYQTNIDQALGVIQTLANELYREPQWREKMIEPPEILGVDELDHAGILVRVWIKVKPLQHWSVGREFRRRLKQQFDEAGISIGTPQQALMFKNALDLMPVANGHQPPSIHNGG